VDVPPLSETLFPVAEKTRIAQICERCQPKGSPLSPLQKSAQNSAQIYPQNSAQIYAHFFGAPLDGVPDVFARNRPMDRTD
jgi:hypothetical protein